MESKLSLKTYISAGFGQFGDCLVTGLVTGYVVYFATNVLGLAALAVGNIMLISRIFDGITDLGMGVVLDHTHTNQGKARPWILRSCIPFAVFSVLIFSIPVNWSNSAKLVALFLTYNLYALAFTALGIAKNSLTSFLTHEDKKRVTLTTVMMFCGILGNVVFNVFAVQILTKLSKSPDGSFTREGFLIFSTVLSIVSVIGSLLNYFNTKEITIESAEKKEKGTSLRAVLSLLKNKYWLIQTGVQFAHFLGLFCRLTAMIYFVQYVLQDMRLASVIVLADQVPGLIAMPLAAKIVTKFGKRNTVLAGNIISFAGLIIMLVGINSIPLFLFGLIFRSIFYAPYSCTTNAFIADTASYGKWRNNIDVDAYAFSIASFAQKVGQGLSGALVGYIMAFSGFDAELKAQSVTAQNGITFIYVGVTVLMTILQVVLLAFYNLDNKMPEINETLARQADN